MSFPYEKLQYLKARGPADKSPLESWGGYGQDFEEAECWYSHEYVKMHPHQHWLVNGMHDSDVMSHQLLVFDLDIHKAPSDFDPDRVTVPEDAPVVKSQSGGFHVYFAVNWSTRAKESDFEVHSDLPFDIDIRGEFVKHHVVAPADIPGVSGDYDLVNDVDIPHVSDPNEAASRVRFDGEPAVEYTPGRSGPGNYDREDVDPPESMPKCYGAGLTLRAEAPEDHDHTHKVNVLTALAGLAAGYEVDTVVDHFVEDYYPGDPGHADRERTKYQVNHIAEKLDEGDYSPPAVRTLIEYGILPEDETCLCGLPGHDEQTANQSAYYEADLAGIADLNGYADPFADNVALLKTCLEARERRPELGDERPPYAALVGVASVMGIPLDQPEDEILGESSYKVARRMFDDLQPGDI